MKYEDNWIHFETDDLPKYLSDYMSKKYKIYDADECGDKAVQFVITDENLNSSFYKFTYTWYCDYDSDEYIIDDVYYEELNSVTFKYPKFDRDWIDVRSWKYCHDDVDD